MAKMAAMPIKSKILQQSSFPERVKPHDLQFIILSHISNLPYLNTDQLVDTTLWLKPWLKSISFGPNLFFPFG